MPNHFHGILRIVGNDKANPTDQKGDGQVEDRQEGDQKVAPLLSSRPGNFAGSSARSTAAGLVRS